MGRFELKLPAMGEGVQEAVVISWRKQPGDKVVEGDIILEVATDKVDNEIIAEVSGVLLEHTAKPDEVVQVGCLLGVISTVDDVSTESSRKEDEEKTVFEHEITKSSSKEDEVLKSQEKKGIPRERSRFYSPLVKRMANKEGISLEDLDTIPGTGANGRLTKSDLLVYLKDRKSGFTKKEESSVKGDDKESSAIDTPIDKNAEGRKVIPMGRVRKLIADHMVDSLKKSAHVQTFIDVDVTNLVRWRNDVKDAFYRTESEKLTFTPIFVEAIARALREYPSLNSSIEGDNIIQNSEINIGMATALPDGNLIVPVIKSANTLTLSGLARAVNGLAERARKNSLKPEETTEGTYTFTNIGSFGSLMGTPIINQPQVGILAIGAIQKVPAVIEYNGGDCIAIRHKMYLSHSYDHRIVDGALGGLFVKYVAEYLENWDTKRTV